MYINAQKQKKDFFFFWEDTATVKTNEKPTDDNVSLAEQAGNR